MGCVDIFVCLVIGIHAWTRKLFLRLEHDVQSVVVHHICFMASVTYLVTDKCVWIYFRPCFKLHEFIEMMSFVHFDKISST